MTDRGDAIHRSVTVDATVEHAFRTWVEQIDRWWPKDHSISRDPETSIVLEGRVGGRFFERTRDGSENEFGAVTVYDPPHRIVYHWYLGTGREQPTEVDVAFTPRGTGTRVEVRHRGVDLVGPAWYQKCAGYERAWGEVVPCFVAWVEKAARQM